VRPGSPRVGVFFLFLSLVVTPGFAQKGSPQPLITQPLITQAIDESQLTTLKGNTYPLAQPQFDIGIAQPDMPLNRMLLVLKRGPQQDFALRKMLDDQQDKASPNYHKWVTPDEFGAQFGPSDQDVQLVTGWLQSHGLQVNRIAHGRGVIEFTGVESQIEAAFHTQIHAYMVNGQQHWANASDPQIPAALAPAVAGISSLNDFPKDPLNVFAGVFKRDKATGKLTPVAPQFSFPSQYCSAVNYCFGLAPYDFAAIYNVLPLWKAGINGTEQTIAIVGETDINPQDAADFRNLFDLPAQTAANGNPLNIIVDGPDPGFNGDESEADIDVQWSGAVAPYATIDFVTSQSTETTSGIDLSALYIVDNNLAPVMSESYGACELALGTTGNQFYNALWEEAAAQGISVFISSGDSGSATCDRYRGSYPQPAQYGLAVNGIASTPFNVAVGGTDFNDFSNPLTYWSTTDDPTTQASAKGYIPETTWNDSCTNAVWSTVGYTNNAETNCNDSRLTQAVTTVGGGGGASNCIITQQQSGTCSGGYTKPSWQVGTGVPADLLRDLPDVSLFASNGFLGSFYIVCQMDQTSNQPCDLSNAFLGFGGTSVASPAFAGIMALVNQNMGSVQGDPNFIFYKLDGRQAPASCNSSSPSSTCVFNDVTVGTIAMPCQTGSPNCTTAAAGDQFGVLNGYPAGAGYDQATGLGTVNVNNLVNQWNTVVFRATTSTVALSPTASLTHGQAVTVNGAVAPGSGSGTPTGSVSLLTSSGVSAGSFPLSNGALSGSTTLLPGGSYTVTANYAGDTTFGGSDSAPVNITVGPENSSEKISLVTFDWQGNLINPQATTAVYGSPYLLRVDVLDSTLNSCTGNNGLPQFSCPTGNVTLTDNGSLLDVGTYPLNSEAYTEDPTVQLPGGTDSVKAQYPGDTSFNPSSTTTALNITPAATTTTGTFYNSIVGQSYQAYATVQSQSTGVVPAGTVTFYSNGNPIPGTVTYASSTNPGSPGFPPTVLLYAYLTSSGSPFPAPGNYTLTASYGGDGNYQTSTSSGTTLNVRFGIPTVNLQSSPNPVNLGSSTTLTATVLGGSPTIAPTGTISFFEPLLGLGALPGTVTYVTVTDPNTGNLDLQGKLSITPSFTDGYFANYNGDTNYPAGSVCCTAFVTVNGNDFALSAQQSSASTSQGISAFYSLIVGMRSNTSPVSFGANACTGLPAEASCSFSPDPNSITGFVSLQISTTGPHSVPGFKPSGYRSQLFWAGSMLPFAAILLIGYRRGRTERSLLRLLLTFLLLLGIACGGGGAGGGGGGGGGGGTPPSAPTNLTATAASYNEIDLNWIQPGGAAGFTIYRSTTSGFTPSPSNQIATYSYGYAPSYPDAPLAPSTAYYYVVKATNGSGLSGPSNQASATTQALDPGTPTGTYNITVTATSGSFSHSVILTLVVQ
jgi:hypothetical protein